MVTKELIDIYKWRKIFKVTDAIGQVLYLCEMTNATNGSTKTEKDIKTLYKEIDKEVLYLKILDMVNEGKLRRFR